MITVMIMVMNDHHVVLSHKCVRFPIFSMGIFASSAKAGIARPSERTVASATTNLFMDFLRLIETTKTNIYRKRKRPKNMRARNLASERLMGVLPDLSYIVLYCVPNMRFRQPAPVRIGRWPCRLDAVDFDRSPHAGVVLVGERV